MILESLYICINCTEQIYKRDSFEVDFSLYKKFNGKLNIRFYPMIPFISIFEDDI